MSRPTPVALSLSVVALALGLAATPARADSTGVLAGGGPAGERAQRADGTQWSRRAQDWTRAEYSPRMEPGRLAVRHASWAAAGVCRARWPVEHGGSVELRVVLDRRGRVRSVAAMPEARAFARCVRRELARQRFSVTGPDAEDARWEVVTRFVFPDEPAPPPAP